MSDVVTTLAMAINYLIIPQPILGSYVIPSLTNGSYPPKQQEEGCFFQSRSQMRIISARALNQLTQVANSSFSVLYQIHLLAKSMPIRN